MNKEAVRAYLAGIIDGEGCITITRRKVRRVKTNNWFYEPQIIIANSCKTMLDFCAGYYGGWIAILKKRKGHTTAYQWKATGDEMRAILKDVLPYLIVRRKQANKVLSFPSYMSRGWGNKPFKGRSQEELKEQEDLWIELKKLNSRGAPKISRRPFPRT